MAKEAGADEGIEAEVLLAFACFGVDGRIGFGLVELGIEALQCHIDIQYSFAYFKKKQYLCRGIV